MVLIVLLLVSELVLGTLQANASCPKGQITIVKEGKTSCIDTIDVFGEYERLQPGQNTSVFDVNNVHYRSEEVYWMKKKLEGEQVTNIDVRRGERLELECGIHNHNMSYITRFLRFSFRRLTIFGWLGYDPWAMTIESSDGRKRLLWLLNLQRLTNVYGRVRTIGDRLYIDRLQAEDHESLYSCWRIDTDINRTAKHYRLRVEKHGSSWFDPSNPISWLKWTILLGYFAFIVWALNHYNVNDPFDIKQEEE